MILTAPLLISRTNIEMPKDISSMTCGLFRANLVAAPDLMPELSKLFDSIPISLEDRHNWEVDVKIHMLQPTQFPCNSNWHCDNIIRKQNQLQYEETYKKRFEPNQKMLLWISGSPETEFLAKDLEIDFYPKTHGDLAAIMDKSEVEKMRLEPQAWYWFDRTSPHRGNESNDFCWRIFVRVTHKSITPERPKVSAIRRHAQVYMDKNSFTW